MNLDAVAEYAANEATLLIQQGMSREDAIAVVSEAIIEVLQPEGLGQAFAERIAKVETIEKAKEFISPWLWVFSIVGFGLALLNTRRVSLMFRKFRKGQE